MKVVELIRKLNEIGYDENTELTFGCTDGNTGEYYDISFKEICYGEELTGESYTKDQIDIELDVDSAKDYFNAKYLEKNEEEMQKIIEVMSKYGRS